MFICPRNLTTLSWCIYENRNNSRNRDFIQYSIGHTRSTIVGNVLQQVSAEEKLRCQGEISGGYVRDYSLIFFGCRRVSTSRAFENSVNFGRRADGLECRTPRCGPSRAPLSWISLDHRFKLCVFEIGYSSL